MINLGKKLGFAVILAFGVVTSAQALVLDTFDYNMAELKVTNASPTASSTQTTLLGFNAKYDLEYNSDGTGLNTAAEATVKTAADALFYTSAGPFTLDLPADNAERSEVSVRWDGETTIPGPIQYFPPLDLTLGGADSFYFDLFSIDLEFDFELTVEYFVGAALEPFPGIFTYAGGFLSETFTSSIDGSLISTPTTEYIAFSNFLLADLTQVRAVTFKAIGVPDADFVLTEVGTTSIPEPATVALFGLALVGFAFSSRKKAK